MTGIAVLFPWAYRYSTLDEALKSQFEIWREEKEQHAEKWTPVNIRFAHDPDWRSNLISIQCARDGNHVVWQTTRVLYSVANVIFAAAPIITGVGIFYVAVAAGLGFEAIRRRHLRRSGGLRS